MTAETSFSCPKNVTYLDTKYCDFKYPTAMKLGEIIKITEDMTCENIDGASFHFEIMQTIPQQILLVCRRTFTEAFEEDNGCFLHLCITVIGVDEKPKVVVLEPSSVSVSVKFMETSFLRPRVNVNNMFILKCVFRTIETTVLSNELREEQERIWQAEVLTVCNEPKTKEDMAYVLNCPNLQGFFTGRKVDHELKCRYVKRACSYSGELAEYFRSKREPGSSLPDISVDKILGYIFYEEDKVIDFDDCGILYMIAIQVGLLFLNELTMDYLIQNLNSMDNDALTDVLVLADLTDNSTLFDADSRFCVTIGTQFFDSRKWTLLVNDEGMLKVAISIFFGFTVRFPTGYEGFLPPIEEES